MKTQSKEEWVKADEAANRFGVSKGWIEKLAREGRVERRHGWDGIYMYSFNDVEQCFTQRELRPRTRVK